ncbi:capping protein inhibiting regulator of actin dynamics [Pholidichthys leucotaenia]
MSQENVSDKVRNLQRQIAQGIKFGQRPPSLRKSEGDEGSSDEEEVPRSPLKVMAQVEAEPPKTEPKVQAAQPSGPHSPPMKSPRSKRVLPLTGTIESINLDAVPQSVPLLDNTAAKHKLSVKPKNQRISRKHRRFTQDLQEVSIPDVVSEDLEATGVSADEKRRASVESGDSFKKQRLYEEEETKRRRELEEQRLRQEEEERRRRELEELRIRQEEEERRRKAEELRQRQLEEERCRKLQQEEEERRLREEAERKRRQEEEEQRIREEEERRRREEEEERMRRLEEERRIREEEERRRQEEEEEERRRLEEQRRKEEEERKRREEEERKKREEEEEARRLREEEEERKKKEEAEKLRLKEMEERRKKAKEEEGDGSSDPQERKRRAEELRWREMEERQRPFSFKVSSGEKQILFQKVNLTPVTPASGLQSTSGDHREGAKVSSSEGPDSPNLPTSPYVPHTAILVTGAQLCGTAVNLDQIKDTACKSLLGLGEDRKAQGTPPMKPKTSPDRKSGKTKSLNESALSTDQSSAAVLAEWASIRSKIFKGVEEGKYDEYPEPGKSQAQSGGEEQPPFAHANLRKTVSASAKFSITPAKKKFGDSNRNSEVFGPDEKDLGEEASGSPTAGSKPQSRTSKTVRILERGSEECMFAKDLPSFLVPSPGARPEGLELKSRAQSEVEALERKEDVDERGQDGEEKPSPFGIKLRRTNYSLRFHSEQSTEKRKKRYSAGDSFDGVPSPLTPIEPDSDASSVFSDRCSPTSPQKESTIGKYLHAAASPAVPRSKPSKSPSPTTLSEGEKMLSKPPIYRRPTTSPKPTGAVSTPPPSRLPKAVHGPLGDDMSHRKSSIDSSSQEQQVSRSEEPPFEDQIHRGNQGEEEPKEKRSFFPSINIPWREKTDRKTELIKREKPSLQSRHSLDSAKVQEKEAGPLWITLALQKQKGFREQQQSREERRSQREAKLAEKQARDSVMLVSPTESRGSESVSPSSKPQTPEEPKRPDCLLGRFERRENLKKANTLPSSITVEIADSTPSPPSVKDVSKRFPSSDSPQSTEPAWLALAKRKAKAWSDCPQIIK